MQRVAGIRDRNICLVAGHNFDGYGYVLCNVPSELGGISDEELIASWQVSDDGKFTNKHVRVSDVAKLKVAFIGNWKQQCGISTYNEKLWPEIAKYVGDYKLFIEVNDKPTSSMCKFGGIELPPDKVVQCWKRGDSLLSLANIVQEYNPDVVLIGHEFGIFPNARYWLVLMCRLQQYRTITTMHSVFQHEDKAICEAAMQDIVVHNAGAKNVLQNEKQVSGKISVIPHGCDTYVEKPDMWNFYKSNHVFAQIGFGSPYKCFEDCIIATSILKSKYDDIFFTALFSESPFDKNGHAIYYNQLMELVDNLELQDNVSIIRGFQSDKIVEIFLRMNAACVLPYRSDPAHKVWGASGVARLAMSYGVPVISSHMQHFGDLPTVKCETPEEIAVELDKFFCSPNNVAWQLERQNKYLAENSWDIVAQKYIDVFLDD